MTLKTKIYKAAGFALVLTSGFFVPFQAQANPIHTHRISFSLGTGIEYEQSRRITRAGLVDVHILTIDMTQPGVTVGPALPEHGGRNTTTGLLQNNGAVAGINADFFNMARNPGTPYGQVIQNGVPLQITRQEGYAATFGVDMENNPFISFLNPDLIFLNDGMQVLHIRDMNKITGQIVASIFDRNAIYTTAGIDARQAGLVKIVADNGYITHISYPGELIHVPENGFIVVLSEGYSSYFMDYIRVGQTAILDIRAAVDLDNIWNAIGGGGQFLHNGQVTSGWVPSPNARHPRSAVGISEDGNTVFLVAVDGRNHSIGATHAEMAEILLGLGAFNAIHLDGGGSTTMGIRTPGTEAVRGINVPSDGGQRRVVNALGVFNNAAVGVITDVALRTYPRGHIFVGDALHMYPVGLDDHLNPVALSEAARVTPWANIARTANRVYPTLPGNLDIELDYHHLNTRITVPVWELAEIVPSHRTLDLASGETAAITFVGLSPRGHRGSLNQVEVNVIPEQTGTFVGGVFTAGTQSGVIQARVGGITTYIGVNINEQGQVVHPVGNVARNPYRGMLDIHGPGFDLTIVGDTSLGALLEADELSHFVNDRNDAMANFILGSNLGVFAGPTQVENIDGFQTLNWTTGYSLRRVGMNENTALISLNAGSGSITANSVYNWRFIEEVSRYNPDHVIILINRPISSLPAYEQQMLLHALEEMANHRTVFVVSSHGIATTNHIVNGVTHINLGALFEITETEVEVEIEVEDGTEVEIQIKVEGVLNLSFNILRFRIGPAGIHFDLHQ